MAQSPSIEAIFGALTVEMRGFVLGATLLGLDEAGPPCLAEPAAQGCAAAVAALARLSRDAKSARLGQLARELGTAYPAGLDLVHSGWIRKALAAEPSDLLTPLVAGAPPGVRSAADEILAARARESHAVAPLVLPAEVAAELRRFVFVSLTSPMPEVTPDVSGWFALAPHDLLFEVRRLGARSLGASLVTATIDVRARAMAAVGAALAQDLRHAAETSDRVARSEGESDVKAVADVTGGTVEERLEQMGILGLERRFRAQSLEVRRALALRLPVRLGRRLLPPGSLGESV